MPGLQDIVSQYPDDIGGAYNPSPPQVPASGLASVATPLVSPMSPPAAPVSSAPTFNDDNYAAIRNTPTPPPAPAGPLQGPAQTPDEVRNAQQAILSSPALSDQQKQTALAALPKLPPGAPGLAGAAPGPSPGVPQMQGEGRGPAVPVPYPRPGAPGAGAGGTGLTANDYLTLASQGGGGGGPRPGWNPNTRTVEGFNYAPGTLGAVGRTVAADQAVREAQFGADIARGGAENKAGQVLALHDEMQAAQDKIRRDAQVSELGKYHDHIQALQANAEEASKINPNQFWDSKTTGQKIMLGLGMALRGFGAALTHSGDDPMKWLSEQIHENIEAQKAKASGARQAVGDAQNLYQFNKERLGDEDRAYQATALAQRTALQGQLQRYVGDATAEPMGRLRAAQMAQANAQEISSIQRDLDEKTAKVVTSEKFTAPGTGGGRDILAQVKRANELKSGLETLGGTDIGTRGKEAEIAHTVASTEAEQKKLATPANKAQVDSYDNALDKLKEVQDMVRKGGTLSASETARGQALKSALMNEIARAETDGTRAPSEAEQKLIEQQLPADPNAFQWTGSDLARVSETIKGLQRARARAAGTAMPGEIPPGVTPGAVPGG